MGMFFAVFPIPEVVLKSEKATKTRISELAAKHSLNNRNSRDGQSIAKNRQKVNCFNGKKWVIYGNNSVALGNEAVILLKMDCNVHERFIYICMQPVSVQVHA